jgi:hypothetical protein
MTYEIPPVNLNAGGQPLFLPDILKGDSLAGCTAAIDFKVTKGSHVLSLRNPVLVVR